MSVWTASPLVVGHRGGRGEGWPRENTLEAFDRARREGATAIELDARSCSTGEVVVSHDASEATLAELRAQGVPTLEDALRWAREHAVAVNVELKHDVPDRVAFVRRALRSIASVGADVLLSSFDPRLLSLAAALASRLPRALLVHRDQTRWAHALQELVRPPFVQALHLERRQTEPAAVAAYLARGLRIGVWTVNDVREASDLVRLGVATLITDRPGELLGAMART